MCHYVQVIAYNERPPLEDTSTEYMQKPTPMVLIIPYLIPNI